MARKDFCDGGCGVELSGNTTDVMIRRPGAREWRRHSLCAFCAERNIFIRDLSGSYVPDTGFASDVLR